MQLYEEKLKMLQNIEIKLELYNTNPTSLSYI